MRAPCYIETHKTMMFYCCCCLLICSILNTICVRSYVRHFVRLCLFSLRLQSTPKVISGLSVNFILIHVNTLLRIRQKKRKDVYIFVYTNYIY